jgi:uncharacterized membrane protein
MLTPASGRRLSRSVSNLSSSPNGSPYPPPPGGEAHWPAQLTVLAAIALQVLLPSRLTVGSKYILPGLEAAMLLALFIASPQRLEAPHSLRRQLTLTTTAIVSLANGISLALLAHYVLNHNSTRQAHQLIIAGTLIWLTNVLIFSLWYWEIDRRGPGLRAAGLDGPPDFLFPNMTDEIARLSPGWRPHFVDYLYVSLTNATAFSPTDTMPLTSQAKMMMGLQSLVSLVTLGLVVARAVNIL